MEFNTNNNNYGKYKMEVIWDSAVYTKKSKSGSLPSLYYLISRKKYPEEENIQEPALAFQHLRKLISSFYKDYSDKLTVTFLPINIAPPMAKPIIKLTKPSKQKHSQSVNSTNKRAKKK